MMITWEERKQIAAKLRAINPDDFYEHDDCCDYLDALEVAFGYLSDDWEFAHYLADLIDPEPGVFQFDWVPR